MGHANYNPRAAPSPPADVTIFTSDYTNFLLYRPDKKPTLPVTIVVQSGNPIAFVSQSSAHGTWILDSDASDHMTGNQSLFTQLSFSDSLSSITLTNGSQIKVCGIGQTHSLPNLSLDSVCSWLSFQFNFY